MLFQKKPVTSCAEHNQLLPRESGKLWPPRFGLSFQRVVQAADLQCLRSALLKKRICGRAITQAHVGNSSVRGGKRKSTHGKTKRLPLMWAVHLLPLSLAGWMGKSVCRTEPEPEPEPCLNPPISEDQTASGNNAALGGTRTQEDFRATMWGKTRTPPCASSVSTSLHAFIKKSEL